MSNKTRKNKNIRTGVIVGVIVLLVVTFFTSNKDKAIDPAAFADLEVQEITAHEKGTIGSEIRLIEYSDFQCPACGAAAPAVKNLVEEFGDQFVLEYRHFPLRSIHPNAQIASQASEAAGIQGKFWEMHDLLFENQGEWSQSFNPESRYFKKYAEELGLNVDRFKFDMNSDEVKDRVNSDADEAAALALPGTPAFVHNGEKIEFQEFINTYLETPETNAPQE